MKARCKHCGRRYAPGRGVGEYCCAGCASVRHLIEAEGLSEFYALREGLGTPPAAGAGGDFGWAERARDGAEAAAADGAPARLELRLEGMHCMGCVWLVERLGRRAEGVTRVRAGLASHRLWLSWRKGRFDLRAYLDRLGRFGFGGSPWGGGLGGGGGRGWRTALCIFFAGNVFFLALSAPHLSGAFGGTALPVLLALAFEALSLAVGGGHMVGPAFRSLSAGRAHVDLFPAFGACLYCGHAAGTVLGSRGGGVEAAWFPMVMAALAATRWAQTHLWRRAEGAGAGPRGIAGLLRGYHLAAGPLILLGGILLWWRSGWESASTGVAAALIAGGPYAAAVWVEAGRSRRGSGALLAASAMGAALALCGWLSVPAAALWQACAGIGPFLAPGRYGRRS